MTARVPLSYVLALILAFGLGCFAGRLWGLRLLAESPVTLREDTRPSVQTLDLEGIEGGAVVGRASDGIRISVRGEALPVTGGELRVPLSRLPAVTTVRVPAGMRFVASKTGKKYYDVDSVAAERLAPDTRVYFADEESAEAAGYVR